MRPSLVTILLCIAGAAIAADEQDMASVGAERARLGDARIQQDMERRSREEEQRLAAAEQESVAVQEAPIVVPDTGSPPPATASPQVPAATVPVSPDNSGMAETLELLRTLGELKDAGYVTEEEYNKLKQKVLADAI